QTGEGALAEVHSMLQRVRDLAVQYANGTLSDEDKAAITSEVKALGDEVTRIGNTTKFNSISLLSGSTAISLQLGTGSGSSEQIAVNPFALATAVSLAFDVGVSVATNWTIDNIDAAIKAVSTARADFGSVQNRLEHTLNNLASYEENLTASESRIRDVDMASEMVNFTKNQILQQAGTAMLAQANTAPQAVLSLLR
ncbi:MAG TPA: flagellin, partial [Gaiellaceae bacterium]|nr:flagellin [Gaiellaceae bacterium]